MTSMKCCNTQPKGKRTPSRGGSSGWEFQEGFLERQVSRVFRPKSQRTISAPGEDHREVYRACRGGGGCRGGQGQANSTVSTLHRAWTWPCLPAACTPAHPAYSTSSPEWSLRPGYLSTPPALLTCPGEPSSARSECIPLTFKQLSKLFCKCLNIIVPNT